MTLNGHASIESALNDPSQHSRIEDELAARLEFARQNGVLNLIVFSGNRRDGLSEEQGVENTIVGLKRLAPLAEAAKVTLLLELLNSKVDHVGYQCDHTARGSTVVSSINSPRVKLLYDIYHMQIMEGDLIRTIEANIPLIGHFHTAGNPGRRDMDDTQEIAYPALFRAIDAFGYSGYIGHEFIPKGDPIEALRKAYLTCELDLGF